VGWSLVITVLLSIAYSMVGILKNALLNVRKLLRQANEMVIAYREKKGGVAKAQLEIARKAS